MIVPIGSISLRPSRVVDIYFSFDTRRRINAQEADFEFVQYFIYRKAKLLREVVRARRHICLNTL